MTGRARLLVIGGDAAGMSAAAQARRIRDEDELEIVVLEQGGDTSFSACGRRRTRRSTVCPVDSSWRVSSVPISPDAPEIRTRSWDSF